MPAAIPATSWRVEGSARFDSSHIAAPHTAQVTAYGAQHTTTVQIQDGEGGFGVSTLVSLDDLSVRPR